MIPVCFVPQLSKHLPARAEGYTWALQYSTSKHGFSLKTLYREMTKTESPILIIIEDTLGSVSFLLGFFPCLGFFPRLGFFHSGFFPILSFETCLPLTLCDFFSQVFGALTSCPLKTSDLFYGTGESFLFSFYPEFRIFTWSGDNQYFIKGNPDSLAIGAGE